MSELLKTPEPQASPAEETSPQVEKKTPNKRGRMSFIERAQKESEELVKNMGGSLELEGGRRTRSSARGTPSNAAVVTPPPAKKARNSPASPKSTPRARGRGRKLETTETPEPPEQQQSKEEEENLETSTPITAENEVTPEKSAEKPETNGPEKSTEENVDEAVSKEPKSAEAKSESEKVKNESAAVKESNEADQVDSALESVQEHHEEKPKSSQEEGGPIKSNEPSKNAAAPEAVVSTAPVDSPMDVDEQSVSQDVAVVQHDDSKSESIQNPEIEAREAIATVEAQPAPNVEKVAEPIAVEKQPTPEPMEIDSSSKSSDVIECTDVVDKAGTIVSATPVESTSSVGQQADKPVSNVFAKDSLAVADKATEVLKQLQSNSEENGTTGEINANAVTENDISVAPVAAEVKSIDVPAATEEPKTGNVIESKTENNIDEPKLTPPQLNAAGDAAVTTI